MPDITIRNLTGNTITVPGGHYVGTIAPFGSVTFDVPETDEYAQESRVVALVDGGTIRLEYDSDDTQDRPMPVYTAATLPVASTLTAGTMVWNSTTKTVNVSDGTNWDEIATGSSTTLTAAATAIEANRFVGLNGSALVAVSPASGERPLGVVANAVAISGECRVAMGGAAEVMTATPIAADEELIVTPGGMVAPFQASDISLGTAVIGADTDDDLVQTGLPEQVQAVCAGIETGSMIVYGDVGGNYTKETVSLVGGAATYTTVATFAAVYCIEFTVAAVGTIDVEDGAAVAIIPTQIPALAAARMYGAIVPDVATDPQGQHVRVYAGGANATDCVIWGTDYLGAEQAEVVTMNGTAPVDSTLAYLSFDQFFIGADAIAFGAGVTSQYSMDVEANERNEIRAYALETEATAGATVQAFLLPQGQGLDVGTNPMPFHTSQVSWGGGAATTTTTVIGVLATD
ncbi:hypothetical protein LCGC14_2422440, partial [marine sediment metagenome]